MSQVASPVESLQTLASIIESRMPGSAFGLMCQKAVDLHEATAATGDNELTAIVERFVAALQQGIYNGLVRGRAGSAGSRLN